VRACRHYLRDVVAYLDANGRANEGGAKPLTCHARSLSARFVSAQGNYRARAALAFVQLKGRQRALKSAPRTCSTLSHSLNPCVFLSLAVCTRVCLACSFRLFTGSTGYVCLHLFRFSLITQVGQKALKK
jgi:hypothetical protein